MKWITRERAKVDRIACPWLISRFIDPHLESVSVPTGNAHSVVSKSRCFLQRCLPKPRG
jgi:hypothetical protein